MYSLTIGKMLQTGITSFYTNITKNMARQSLIQGFTKKVQLEIFI